MKILFLSELFHPNGGGAELATYLYAKLLSEAGSDVVVVTNKFGGEPEFSKNGNLTIYRLPLFKKNGSVKYSIFMRFNVLFSKFMRKIVKWADVVYVARFWYSAIPFAKALRTPVITQLHDYIPICPLSNIYDVSKHATCDHKGLLCSPKCIYAYEKIHGRSFTETLTSMALNSTLGAFFGKSVGFSDAIICVSKFQRRMIVDREPSLREKTCVIYNPLPKISHIEMEGDDFAYFGGPDYLKGFHTLYKALMHLNRERVNRKATRIHATKFPNSFGWFAKSSRELGISLYGKLDRVECNRLYKQVRAVIVPSICHEPWPYVVSEAIARGRFVIASRVGGIPEQVEGCKGALLCEPGNSKQLAEAIEFVGSLDREDVAELGFQSKEKFSKRFDNTISIRSFISICENLA
jgi:glycosyltransferase involved in cell wall biosynthesis